MLFECVILVCEIEVGRLLMSVRKYVSFNGAVNFYVLVGYFIIMVSG